MLRCSAYTLSVPHAERPYSARSAELSLKTSTGSMAPSTHSAAYTAVVSGASGFIGTELVKQLLEKGYTVRGTVRSTSNKEKTQHLTQLAEVGLTCPVLHASLCKQVEGLNSLQSAHRLSQEFWSCTRQTCSSQVASMTWSRWCSTDAFAPCFGPFKAV